MKYLNKSLLLTTAIYAIVVFLLKIAFSWPDPLNRLQEGIAALIQGFVFSLIFTRIITVYISNRDAAAISIADILSDDELVFEGKANYLFENGADNGKIFLTDKRIIFRSNKYVYGKNPKILDLENIETLSSQRLFSMMPNTITFSLKDGGKEKFSVQNRKEFLMQFAKNTS